MKENKTNFLIGVFCVSGYVALAAVREVFFAIVLKEVSLYLVLPLIFSITLVVFTLLNLKLSKEVLSKLRYSIKDVVALNFLTATGWAAFICALQYIEPAIVSSVVTSLGPVVTLMVGRTLLHGYRSSMLDKACAVGIVFSMTWLGFVTISGRSAIKDISLFYGSLGLMCAVVSGVSSAITNIYAKRLSNRGFSSTETLSVRFYLLVIVSIGYAFLTRPSIDLGFDHILIILGLAIFGIGLPLFLLQEGINRMNVNSVALMMALAPLATYFFQLSRGAFSPSFFSLVGVLSTFAFVSMGIWLKARRIPS